MRNLSLGVLGALAVCACGGGGDSAGGTSPSAATPPSSSPSSSAPPPSGVTQGSATLSWTANIESDLNGYRIYYGTAPGTYIQGTAQGVNVGNVTSHIVNGLTRGQRYYFVVTAYDTSGNESPFSREQFKDIP